MSFMKYLPHPAIIAILAFTMQYIGGMNETTQTWLIVWVSFQAWALYFLAGCTVKNGIKATACYALGVLFAMLIVFLGTRQSFGKMNEFAFPVAVFIVAFIVILFEKIPALNLIPAYFLGAGSYFGHIMSSSAFANSVPSEELLSAQMGPKAFGIVMASCIFGMLYGVVTVFLRGKYDEIIADKADVDDVAKAA